MRTLIVVAVAGLLAACGSQDATGADKSPSAGGTPNAGESSQVQAAAAPNLSACPRREPVDEEMRQRTKPIPVPAAFGEVMRSDMDNLAFATLDGSTICVDASWFESIRDAALSPDKRFASFGWDGYESYGHVIVDRSGKGQVVDSGVPPLASPSGKRLAAMDLSESGFGALNAFAVWEIVPGGLRELAREEQAPAEVTDWQIERWSGEDCMDLSAVAWDDMASETPLPRKAFKARARSSWRLEPGRCADT